MAPRRDALACPWKGVSLGGWLLLEPGPSYPLFEQHVNPEDGEQGRCEWDVMKILRATMGKKEAVQVIQRHRESHITKADFQRIRGCGMNAVRLPFGYWVVLGPSANELYVGPALEYIDRAVDWAEECGLQIVLDLHGCPGGESGEAPCGRRQRPEGTWHWKQWRFNQSLEALKVLVQRYKPRRCVTGVAVCNEPSNTVPLPQLFRYYERAVEVVRGNGMPASNVAVVLPIFQRDEETVIEKWHSLTGGRHRNVCFDVHCYHCFENEFNGKTFAQQLRAVGENAKMLQNHSMVVGEWSLALGCATWSTCGQMSEFDVYRLFGRAQIEAFKEASHGSFFWNWTERAESLEWNFQLAHRQGLLSSSPLQLPRWEGLGEDPLEEKLHPSPPEPRILHGDPVFLRAFHGRYVDVEGSQVSARWPDKGKWQELIFCPVVPASAPSAKAHAMVRREVRDGDAVRLRTRSGRYLSVDDEGAVSAVAARGASSTSTEFVVHAGGASTLRHRVLVYFEHRATGLMLDADDEEERISARWTDRGLWQQFAIEKMSGLDELTPVTPKKQAQRLTKEEEDAVALAAPTPPRRRKALQLGLQHVHKVETPKRRRLLCRGGEATEMSGARAVRVR
mmetsp:Transcript_3665/g.10064  ORF Transcript_3665/g.10064 Transcript_3665/m.10064 type:complete len:621 (-) Transcript_3665:65-1927(-)